MVEHFAAAVRGKEPLACDPEESVRNMEALDALARAARKRTTVALPATREPQRV
jgi:predicted dehydrogenase